MAQHYQQLQYSIISFAVAPDADIYAMLENKWRTYNFCRRQGIPTPYTEIYDDQKPPTFISQKLLLVRLGNAGASDVDVSVRDENIESSNDDICSAIAFD